MRMDTMRKIPLRHAGAVLLSLALGPALAGTASAVSPLKEVGIWYDDTGDGAIKIEQCGETLCGRIHWLKAPLNAKGMPLVDAHNPDSAQRTRPICGLPVVGNLERQPEGNWDSGWVYDPKEGKSYNLAATLDSPNRLQITGYLGMKLLGKTFTWTRAPDNLPSCAGQPAATPASTKTATPNAATPKAAIPAKGAAAQASAKTTSGSAKTKSASTKTAPAAAKAAPKALATGEKLPWAGKPVASQPPAEVSAPEE